MLLPIAIVTARSIWFLTATSTAVECSAALPMMATTMTPTKTLFMPSALPASSTEPTSISLIHATPAVATSSTMIDVSLRPLRRLGVLLACRPPGPRTDGDASPA